MPVIDVQPNAGLHLEEGFAEGLVHVYCTGPGPAQVGIALINPPPPLTMHHIAQGDMRTFQAMGDQVWIWNFGPSRVQVITPDGLLLEGAAVEEVDGADLLTSAPQ